MRLDQWLFTSDEVASSPSILDGLSVSEERLRRAKGINFIMQAGILLDLPQITLWVAGVFFHRFYMRLSMVEEKGGIHHYNIAATALFLANKTEENCQKTKNIIIAVAKVAQKNPKLVIDEQSKEYWRWRDSILTYEELMLEMLTFDLMVDTPYTHLYGQLRQLAMINSTPLRDAAWAYCNDAGLTVLPLLMTSQDISISAIFFAASVTQEKINDMSDEPWWKALGGSESLIMKAVTTMTEFYKENPLRKQDSKIPKSPEFNLESTRRRGENILEADSSQSGTPMAQYRGSTLSPKGGERPNGKADEGGISNNNEAARDNGVKKEITSTDPSSSMMSIDMASQQSRGDSDAALKAAANDLNVHEGIPNGGGLRSPILPGTGLRSPVLPGGAAGGLRSPVLPGASASGLRSPVLPGSASMKREHSAMDIDRESEGEREPKKARTSGADEVAVNGS